MLKYLLLNFFFQTTVAVTAYTQLIFRNKGYSHSLVGVMIAIGQIASVIIPLIVCGISDRTRKTKQMMFVVIAVGIALFIPSAMLGNVMLTGLVFFVASGLYWAMNPLIDGYQSRMLKGSSSNYGFARAAGTMGYVVALIIFGLSGFPEETSNQSICLAFCLTAALFMLSACFVPKDLPAEPAPKNSPKRGFSLDSFSRKFYLMMLVVGLSRIAQAVPDKLLASYMTEELNLGNNFTFLYALGAFCEFIMMVLGGKLLDKGKVSAYTMILISCIGLVVRLLIYYFFPNIYGVTIAQMFHALTFAALHIGVMKFIYQNVDKDHYSMASSIYIAVATNLPATIGSLVGGFIIENLGYPMLFLLYTAFPIASVVLCFVYRKLFNSDSMIAKECA